MRLLNRILALLPWLLAAATSPGARADVVERPSPVGRQHVAYEDPARLDWTGTHKRPLQTTIWYPAAAGTAERPWNIAIFAEGLNALDAEMVARPARLPLIVMSHGTGGSAVTLAWLGETLASHGYIVAAVNHHGNTAAEDDKRLEGTLVWWDRPKDLSVLIDKLLNDPQFGKRIDPDRVGVAGFSLGGYAALSTIGARLGSKQFLASCAAPESASLCKLPPEISDQFSDSDVQRLVTTDPRLQEAMSHMEDSFLDSRVKAAFVIAPVFGQALTKQSLASVAAPVRVVVGSSDSQAVPSISVSPLEASIKGLKLDVLPAVGHYTFISVCNSRGQSYVKPLCVDAAGVDRRAVHALVGRWAVEFFGTNLDGK